MDIKQFIYLYIKSFNPTNYKEIIRKKNYDYFLMLIFILVILGGIFSIPRIIHYPENIEESLAKFNRFNITGIDIQTSEPIILLRNPKTVLDLTQDRELTNETILITKSQIQWKKFRPSLFNMEIFKTEKKPISEYSNVLENANKIKGLYWLIFIVLLPSLFFLVFILNFVKFFVIVILFSLLAYLLLKTRYKRTRFTKILRIAIFSVSLMMTLEIAIAPLFSFGIIPFILFLIQFSTGIYLTTENG